MLNVYEFPGKHPQFCLSHFKQVKGFLRKFPTYGGAKGLSRFKQVKGVLIMTRITMKKMSDREIYYPP